MDTINGKVLNKTKKNKYIYDENHNWLQKYMKNINYDIVENDDVTLFGAVSQLLDESSDDIRAKMVDFVTEEDFLNQRKMHTKISDKQKIENLSLKR